MAHDLSRLAAQSGAEIFASSSSKLPQALYYDALRERWSRRTFASENAAESFLRNANRARTVVVTFLAIGPLLNTALATPLQYQRT